MSVGFAQFSLGIHPDAEFCSKRNAGRTRTLSFCHFPRSTPESDAFSDLHLVRVELPRAGLLCPEANGSRSIHSGSVSTGGGRSVSATRDQTSAGIQRLAVWLFLVVRIRVGFIRQLLGLGIFIRQ
jgi:hypothetical protein